MDYVVVLAGVVDGVVSVLAGVVPVFGVPLSQPMTPPIAHTRAKQTRTASNFFTICHPFNENGLEEENYTVSHRFVTATTLTR